MLRDYAPTSLAGAFSEEEHMEYNQPNSSLALNGEHALRLRTWAEIDLDAVEQNFKQIQKQAKDAKICCVVKANAYGHGAVVLAGLYKRLGAAYLAVSNIEEALQIRQSGNDLPILVLGYTPPACARLLSEQQISQCVFSADYGSELAKEARLSGVKVKIHIKIDTGMGRIGFLCRREENAEIEPIVALCQNSALDPEGIFMHFSSADMAEGREETERQLSKFQNVIRELHDLGVTFRISHCANSAGILAFEKTHMDMVRAGIILYGLPPSDDLGLVPGMKPVMTVRTIISHIKDVEPGEGISYGQTFVADKKMRVATIPIGYADGLSRLAGNGKYSVLISNQKAPILGRVCMDQCMVDVSDIPCSIGDIVTVFGSTEGNTAHDLAKAAQTISYEEVCSVGGRVPRAYMRHGQIVSWTDLLYDSDLVTGQSQANKGDNK